MRSRPTDSSIDRVPACAWRSTPGGGGAPQSTISTLRPACSRWKPPSVKADGPRPPRPAWVSAISIRLLLSSLLPLNSARPPSPCRITRSAGAIRSIAPASAGGGCVCAACSRARISVRSCSAASCAAGLRSAWQPSGSTWRSDLLRQETQRARQEAGMLRQRDGRGDQTLQRGQRPGVQFLGRQRGGQAAGIGHQPSPSASGGTHRPRWRRRSRSGRARR